MLAMKKRLIYLYLRFRFLLFYIVFGFFSLVIELVFLKFLSSFNFSYLLSAILSFLVGLLTAFTLNIRFNFHVAIPKRKKAFLYFSIISIFSFCTQFLLRKSLINFNISLEASRFYISGIFFLISYILHKKISFKEYKKVGIAIYANDVEDIQGIYNKISKVPDFIHIDIVDKSFNKNCKVVKAYRAEVVRTYWPTKKIEVHIMSKSPSFWLDDLTKYVDLIYIHLNIDEDLTTIINKIKNAGCKPGLVISVTDNYEKVFDFIEHGVIKNILILAIAKPGFSGQEFEYKALQVIEELNKLKCRSEFEICVDGGVNNQTIQFLNVESVVSGSYVLNAKNPINNILQLQTSGEYATI